MQKLDLQIVLPLTKNSPEVDLTLPTDPKTEIGEAILEKGTEITTEAIPGKEAVITTEAIQEVETETLEVEIEAILGEEIDLTTETVQGAEIEATGVEIEAIPETETLKVRDEMILEKDKAVLRIIGSRI